MVAVSFTKYRIGEEMADKTTGNRTGGKKSSSETLKKSAARNSRKAAKGRAGSGSGWAVVSDLSGGGLGGGRMRGDARAGADLLEKTWENRDFTGRVKFSPLQVLKILL